MDWISVDAIRMEPWSTGCFCGGNHEPWWKTVRPPSCRPAQQLSGRLSISDPPTMEEHYLMADLLRDMRRYKN